ncbi:MAG: transposase family protein, partial [candidate division NC10 bacterium]|nr:transposase family protein [candidate division NC10 bacterium]
MTRPTRQEYAAALRARYHAAGKRERGRMLDEVCRTTGLHRKAAIRLLRRAPLRRTRRRGRPRRYGPALVPILRRLWELSDRPCAKLLAPLLPTLVSALERHGALPLAPALRAPLLRLSPATLDRLLGPVRRRLGRQPRGPRSSPASLRGQIPLRTFGEWRGVAPGALQGDLVLHCGEHTAGCSLSSLVAVDVATSWTELEAIWGLGQQRVRSGVHHVRQRLPVPLRAWHTDNGSEFINRVLVSWCRREGIRVTRGRDYRKNDQAWVEQKNGLVVRRLVGYDRYASRAAYRVLGRLYRLLRLQLNFLRPVRKLLSKQRVGAKVRKRYDVAQTPYQRLLAAGVLSDAQRQALEQEFLALNPASLAQEIRQTLDTLWT